MTEVALNTEGGLDIKQLRRIYQRQQQQIEMTEQGIQVMRKQLKSLSNSASKIIENKLTKPNGSKSRPKLNPVYQSKKLQQIKDQKQKIYRQIAQTKHMIQSLKQQQEPEVKAQIIKKQTSLREIEKQLAKSTQDKKYVKRQLQMNKQKISDIKKSAYNVDLIENERVLQQLKKQKQTIEKQLYQLSNQQILANMFFFQMKQKTQKVESPNDDMENNGKKVPAQEISRIIRQINSIIETRNKIEKGKYLQACQLKQKIAQLEKDKRVIDKKVRQAHGEIMKIGLEQRFYQSRMQRISKSTSQLHAKQYTSLYSKQAQKTQQNQNADKASLLNQKNVALKGNQNKIQLGSTQINKNIEVAKDSQAQNPQIQKVISISFLINSQQQILGVKCTYLTSEGKLLVGQVMSVDHLQKSAIQKIIAVSEIKMLQFPKSSKSISLKLHKFNSSVESLGIQYYGATIKQNINLKLLKSVEIMLEKNKQGICKRIKGIVIYLQNRKLGEISKASEQKLKASFQLQNDSTFLTTSPNNLIKKSQSIDNVSNYKKKLVLKPIKKQTDDNLDHRLLIRKKLV